MCHLVFLGLLFATEGINLKIAEALEIRTSLLGLEVSLSITLGSITLGNG